MFEEAHDAGPHVARRVAEDASPNAVDFRLDGPFQQGEVVRVQDEFHGASSAGAGFSSARPIAMASANAASSVTTPVTRSTQCPWAGALPASLFSRSATRTSSTVKWRSTVSA